MLLFFLSWEHLADEEMGVKWQKWDFQLEITVFSLNRVENDSRGWCLWG
jgi:hypothetical protein